MGPRFKSIGAGPRPGAGLRMPETPGNRKKAGKMEQKMEKRPKAFYIHWQFIYFNANN
jgi:hypothetical protein